MDLITPLLAQATNNNSDIITWGIILTLTTVAANIVAVVLAFSNRKQKREVSFGFVPASKEEFDKHLAENHAEFTRIREAREKDAEMAGQSRKRLYDKMDDIETQISEMPGRIVTDILNAKKLFDK
jgi:hypothetical protein